MSQITTHVLDTARGCPAEGIEISLYREGDPSVMASGVTNADGRVGTLLADGQVLPAGTYRVHFALEAYLQANQMDVFYPYADIVFTIGGDGQHYHIPLLLSPYGYSTYRGS